MRIRSTLTFVVAAVAALGIVTPAAHADSTPTVRELLDKCDNGTDSCVFHPSSRTEFGGARHQVGRNANNCSTVNQNESIAWSDTTGGSNSIGITITAEYKFGEEFSVAVSATYEHTWTWSHTVTRTDTLTTPPWSVGQIFHAPQMQRVTGTYELHFGKKFYGHYYWYVNNFSATGPVDTDDAVTFFTRAMTSDERGRCPKSVSTAKEFVSTQSTPAQAALVASVRPGD